MVWLADLGLWSFAQWHMKSQWFSWLSVGWWFLETACPSLCQLCTRISASFWGRLAPFLQELLTLEQALEFLPRFSFQWLTSACPNQTYWWWQASSSHLRLIHAQAKRVFRHKNALTSHNYWVNWDHIRLGVNCASFKLFRDSEFESV